MMEDIFMTDINDKTVNSGEVKPVIPGMPPLDSNSGVPANPLVEQPTNTQIPNPESQLSQMPTTSEALSAQSAITAMPDTAAPVEAAAPVEQSIAASEVVAPVATVPELPKPTVDLPTPEAAQVPPTPATPESVVADSSAAIVTPAASFDALSNATTAAPTVNEQNGSISTAIYWWSISQGSGHWR